MKKNQPRHNTRKNYGIEEFDSEEVSLVFQIAERAIVKLSLELEEELDMTLSDLGNLKVRIAKFLDEDIF
jgi:hypothetical protein